jgi:hypothetical protein
MINSKMSGDAEGVGLNHIFSRLDKLAMCINGTISTNVNGKRGAGGYTHGANFRPYYNRSIVQQAVLKERIRQIKDGEAVFTPARALKCSKATIATLYAYKKDKIKAATKVAEEEALKARDASIKRNDKIRTLQGQVTQNAQLIKDYIALGAIKPIAVPKIIKSFEETLGGTEGFIKGMPEEE